MPVSGEAPKGYETEVTVIFKNQDGSERSRFSRIYLTEAVSAAQAVFQATAEIAKAVGQQARPEVYSLTVLVSSRPCR